MFKFIGSLLGGIGSFFAAIPLKVYGIAFLVGIAAWGQFAVLAKARDAGDRGARQELAPKLAKAHADAATRLQQAADAEGRALAFEQGLDSCIGARASMDMITGAVLAQRERQRAAAVSALKSARQELSDAYATTADRCADQPVPDAVIRVLDAKAFGAAGADAHADGEGARAGVHARTVIVDGSDADPAAARSTYRDIAGWIAEGWAPAVHSCNQDKASIAALRADP